MKKIAISQPRYLPASNYIERLMLSDLFVMLDNVQHQKRAFEHRNKIKTPNGIIWLSVPIDRKGSKSDKIQDLIVKNENWEEKHFKSFYLNYKKTSYFNEIIRLLEDFYSVKRKYLNEVVNDMLAIIIKYLEIRCTIEWASDYEWTKTNDELLIEITDFFKGDTYISGPNGKSYIDEKNFRKKNIQLLYHDYPHPIYQQNWGEFVPYLTVWDLLFHHGKDSITLIRSGTLVET